MNAFLSQAPVLDLGATYPVITKTLENLPSKRANISQLGILSAKSTINTHVPMYLNAKTSTSALTGASRYIVLSAAMPFRPNGHKEK